MWKVNVTVAACKEVNEEEAFTEHGQFERKAERYAVGERDRGRSVRGRRLPLLCCSLIALSPSDVDGRWYFPNKLRKTHIVDWMWYIRLQYHKIPYDTIPRDSYLFWRVIFC